MTRAGTMRERITIQSETASADGQGGSTSGWTTFSTVWARVQPLRGREQREALQVQDEQVYQVTVRYLAGVTPKMRILWGARTLNIRSVVNADERKRFLEMVAEEGVG